MTFPAGAVSLFAKSDDPYPGGGAESMVSDSTTTDANGAPKEKAETHTEPMPGKGPLLEEPDPAKCAKKVVTLWTRQDTPMNRRDAYWELYGSWRNGQRGLYVQKFADKNEWRVYSVPGMSSRPMPDKTDELIQRTVANLLADDPVPSVEPEQDTPEARDAAEFEERILKAETGESLLDLPRVMRNALNKAGTFCSAFGWVTVDPNGKGYESEQRLADPNATDANQPACLLDPETGAVSANLTLRYVAEDGQTLTDDPQAAKRIWKPGLKIDVLTGRNFRFLPETTKGIDDADGGLIARYTTKGAMKQAFPVTTNYPDSKWKELADWKLPKAKRLLPKWARDYLSRAKDQPVLSVGDQVPDDTPILTLTLYYKATPDYPDGAYLVVGEKDIFWRDTHYGTYTKKDGTKAGECLLLPIFQVRWWDDSEEDDPYGGTVASKLGPWDEVFATQLSSELDWGFRFNNPNVYLPASSPVQAKALARRDGTPIVISTPVDIPTYEQVPAWPASSRELRDDAREAMNQVAGLIATGAGSSQENTLGNSGIQAQTIVAQANTNLANTRDNVSSAYVRACRICAQLMKVYYTVPDKVSYVGEDGDYKEEEWTGADLSGKTISLARGSMSGLNPQAKMQYIAQVLQMQAIDPHEGARLMNASLSAELGAQDNPYMQRVRRQIGRWLKGPDEDGEPGAWEQQAQAYQAAQQTQQQAQPGQPPMPQAPLPPAPFTPFEPLPIDDEPLIAVIRHQELSRAMVRANFTKFGGAWKALYLAEQDKARKAAGILTIVEQGQQAQAMQQATTQAEVAKAQASATVKGQADLALSDKEQAFEKERIVLTAAVAPQNPAPTALGLEEQEIAKDGGPPVPAAPAPVDPMQHINTLMEHLKGMPQPQIHIHNTGAPMPAAPPTAPAPTDTPS